MKQFRLVEHMQLYKTWYEIQVLTDDGWEAYYLANLSSRVRHDKEDMLKLLERVREYHRFQEAHIVTKVIA